MGAYAIIGILVKDQGGLASVLQPYSEGYVAHPEDGDNDDMDAVKRAMRAPEMGELVKDIANFYSGQPQVIVSEIVEG